MRRNGYNVVNMMPCYPIQYIGQVGVILRRNGYNVVIDPFLSVDQPAGSTPSFWARRYAPPVLAIVKGYRFGSMHA